METPDFLRLSEKANGPTATIEDKSVLFSSFFRLEKWLFICSKENSFPNPRPFITNIDDQSWIFAFTDSNMVTEFAKLNPEQFPTGTGGVEFLSLSVKDALKMLTDMKSDGLFGMHINYGLPGWYVPVAGLPGIMKHLNITID